MTAVKAALTGSYPLPLPQQEPRVRRMYFVVPPVRSLAVGLPKCPHIRKRVDALQPLDFKNCSLYIHTALSHSVTGNTGFSRNLMASYAALTALSSRSIERNCSRSSGVF